MRLLRSLLLAFALSLGICSTLVAEELSPLRLAESISGLGPRPAGSEAAREAERLLLEAMQAAGLEEVGVQLVSSEGGVRNLVGVRRGSSGREILLGAHYDTVVGSPGAADDASGCAVVLSAAARLTETPLQHSLRVVLFDAEEAGLFGSQQWVVSSSDADKAAVLAAVQVEMVGRSDAAGPTVQTLPVLRQGDRRLAPGWLIHAALLAGRDSSWPLAMSDARFSRSAQLVVRGSRLAIASDADSLLAGGIPSIFLSDLSWTSFDPAYHLPADTSERLDGERLEQWTTMLVALARRLDGFASRPRDEDRYLAGFGRVWLRRDLYWLGFLVWIGLVWRGRPGRWKGAKSEERKARGKDYLPGFFFRGTFLAALLLVPVFTTVLVLPAGIAVLLLPRRRPWRLAVAALAFAPLALFVVLTSWMAAQGFLIAPAPPTLGALAVLLALTAFAALVLRGTDGPKARASETHRDPNWVVAGPTTDD